MPSSPLPRLHALLWSASLLLLVAACDCGGGGLPTRTCTTTADCGGSNICIDGTCQEPGVDGGTAGQFVGFWSWRERPQTRLSTT